MPFKLYHSPGACSLAAHILLRETHSKFVLERVDLKAGEHLSEAFLALNPKGRVPVLVHEEQVITELPAICACIAASAKSDLWPKEPLRLARLLEWFNWLSGTVHAQGFGMLWRAGRFASGDEAKAEIRERGRTELRRYFGTIENQLRGPWALGDTYSAVDPFLLVLHLWGTTIGEVSEETHPAWGRHREAMLERNAVRAALDAEGLLERVAPASG